jgi:hypothetical protein
MPANKETKKGGKEHEILTNYRCLESYTGFDRDR